MSKFLGTTPVSKLKSDAKKLKREHNLTHTQALDRVAQQQTDAYQQPLPDWTYLMHCTSDVPSIDIWFPRPHLRLRGRIDAIDGFLPTFGETVDGCARNIFNLLRDDDEFRGVWADHQDFLKNGLALIWADEVVLLKGRISNAPSRWLLMHGPVIECSDSVNELKVMGAVAETASSLMTAKIARAVLRATFVPEEPQNIPASKDTPIIEAGNSYGKLDELSYQFFQTDPKANTILYSTDPDFAGRPIDHCTSVYNHSPTGLNFGYPGSGPTQAALALMCHQYGKNLSQHPIDYVELKRQVIAALPGDRPVRFTVSDLRGWVLAIQQEEPVELAVIDVQQPVGLTGTVSIRPESVDHDDNFLLEDLQALIAGADDWEGHHLLWVSTLGQVHLTCLEPGVSPLDFEEQQADMAVRLRALGQGNGYVGPEAAQDADWMGQLYRGVLKARKEAHQHDGTPTFLDVW